MRRSLVQALLVLLAGVAPARAQTTAVVNVNVVDVRTGTVRRRSTVIVSGDRITRIGPADSVTIPAGAAQVDGANGFLIPGLADMHAHFTRPEDLQVLLAHGVTTVQFLNAFPDLYEWRDSTASGRVAGPDIFPCLGPISSLRTAAQGADVINNAAQHNDGCVKPYGDLSFEAFQALTDEGRRRNIRTVSHIPRNLTWQQALIARPTAIAHAEEFLYSPIESQAAVDSIVRGMRDNHIALIPTLTDYDIIARQVVELPEMLEMPAVQYFSPVHRRVWRPQMNRYRNVFKISSVANLRRQFVFQRNLVKSLDSAGAVILAGTDAGNSLVLPGPSLHDELQQLVSAGLSPAAALRAATSSAADFLNRATDVGTVDEGKRADLVLVYGNPLSDIATTRLIGGVMKSGKWFSRDSLRAMLARIRAAYMLEDRFLDDVERLGVVRAIAVAREHHYLPDQRAVNELAYQQWRIANDTAKARVTFTLNVRLFPNSYMAHGSFGEFLEARGDSAGARRETAIALRLRPGDRELLDQQERLRRR